MGAAGAVGRASRERPARAPRRLHVQRSLRRAVARRGGSSSPAMPPISCRRLPAKGMCSGLRDAVNLAWKLDLVLGAMRRRCAARQLRVRAVAEREGGDRLLHGARQGDLRARSRRGRRARRGDGRRRRATSRRRRPVSPPSRRVHPSDRSPRRHAVRAGQRRRPAVRRGATATAGGSWSSGADVEDIGRDERAWFESIGGRIVALADPDPLFAQWFTRARHGVRAAATRLLPLRHGRRRRRRQPDLLGDLRRHLATGDDHMKLANHGGRAALVFD